jgi:hypothetical protein
MVSAGKAQDEPNRGPQSGTHLHLVLIGGGEFNTWFRCLPPRVDPLGMLDPAPPESARQI